MLDVIIDSNMLRADGLSDFLAASPDHVAVLTDYAWMEAYKGNALITIVESMRILRNYPEQVRLLKSTREVSALDAKAPGITNRMTYRGKSNQFSETLRGLKLLDEGDTHAALAVINHARVANAHMDLMLDNATGLPKILKLIQRSFSDEEVCSIRRRDKIPDALFEKLYRFAEIMTYKMLERHPLRPRMPSRKSLVNSFMFRANLANMLFVFRWIWGGSQLNIRPDKTRNDLIDIIFAVYGTYFSGLMTADRWPRELEIQLRVILEFLGARMPNHYLRLKSN